MKTKTKKSDTSLAITTLPPSPTDERRRRMINYGLTTLIRLVCIIIAFVVPLGWWTILPIIGAVFLPFFAVVVANAGHDGIAGEVESPGGIELYRPENVYHPEDFQGETYRAEPTGGAQSTGGARPTGGAGSTSGARTAPAAGPTADRPEPDRPTNDR